MYLERRNRFESWTSDLLITELLSNTQPSKVQVSKVQLSKVQLSKVQLSKVQLSSVWMSSCHRFQWLRPRDDLDSVYKLRSKTKEDMKPDESDNNSECSEYSPPRYHNEQKNQKDGCCSCFDPDIFWHPFYRPIRKVFHEVFKFFGELCGDIFDIDD